jgi:cytochrome c oxidase subunit 3
MLNLILFYIGAILILLAIVQWWRDVGIEGDTLGLHTKDVEKGLRLGMLLFIVSEVLFFVRFFWAFYHSRLAPAVELGIRWPPGGVRPFNPFGVPLLNTLLLLSSGVSVTWAHHSLIAGEHKNAVMGLGVTVILGVLFTALQGLEYFEASFRMADSVYGSCFFVSTGFHGAHVLIGTTFLLVCFYRLGAGKMSQSHHFGFEAAA